MAKTNSGLLEFKDEQKVLIALDDATSEVKKAVIIDADGTETDIAGGGVTVEALTVTENGTYSEEGKAYSPVTVNVAGGSSDFSTAEVIVINEPGAQIKVPLALNEDNEKFSSTGIFEDGTFNVILYGGTCRGAIPDLQGGTVSVTGNIELTEYNDINITGDGSITILYEQ